MYCSLKKHRDIIPLMEVEENRAGADSVCRIFFTLTIRKKKKKKPPLSDSFLYEGGDSNVIHYL